MLTPVIECDAAKVAASVSVNIKRRTGVARRPCTLGQGAVLGAGGHVQESATVGFRLIALFGHGVGTEQRNSSSSGHGPRTDPTVKTTPTFGSLSQGSVLTH